MTLDERVDRMERLWLLATADWDDTSAVELGRLIRQLRGDHPAVSRSGGQLILAPSLNPRSSLHSQSRDEVKEVTSSLTT